MDHYIALAKNYIIEHKQQFKVGVISAAGILVVFGFVALYIYNTQAKLPKIVYPPLAACDLLTEDEAKALLGEVVIPNVTEPTITGNKATSKCSYSDTNADNFSIAAVAVQSAINDAGDAQNKSDFAENRDVNDIESVSGIGDAAYFNHTNGQLNVLMGHSWLIIAYGKGSGSDVTKYTLQDAITLARVIVDEPSKLNLNSVTF